MSKSLPQAVNTGAAAATVETSKLALHQSPQTLVGDTSEKW